MTELALSGSGCGTRDVTATALQLFLAAVFAVAGVAKLLSGSARADVSLASDALGVRMPHSFALYLAVAECLVAGVLLTGYALPITAGIACAVLVGFALIVARLRRRGFAGKCACFGGIFGGDAVGLADLWRNIALALLAAVIVIRAVRAPCPGRLESHPSSTTWLLAALLFAVATFIYALAIEVERLVAAAKPPRARAQS